MRMFLISFFPHADDVKMANLSQMVNVIAPAVTVVETVPPVSVSAVSLSVALMRIAPSTPESFTDPWPAFISKSVFNGTRRR